MLGDKQSTKFAVHLPRTGRIENGIKRENIFPRTKESNFNCGRLLRFSFSLFAFHSENFYLNFRRESISFYLLTAVYITINHHGRSFWWLHPINSAEKRPNYYSGNVGAGKGHVRINCWQNLRGFQREFLSVLRFDEIFIGKFYF